MMGSGLRDSPGWIINFTKRLTIKYHVQLPLKVKINNIFVNYLAVKFLINHNYLLKPT